MHSFYMSRDSLHILIWKSGLRNHIQRPLEDNWVRKAPEVDVNRRLRTSIAGTKAGAGGEDNGAGNRTVLDVEGFAQI